ncbi:MAG: adenylate/guanylate cyclase domain-containing protein, partial [Acidimicrobiales bacterium]
MVERRRRRQNPPGLALTSVAVGGEASESLKERATRAGKEAQQAAAERLAEQLRRQDPDLLSALAELGVVRQAWLDDPSDGPAVQASRPLDVLQRAMEARSERRPDLLGRLGLSALRLLGELGLRSGEWLGPMEGTLCFTDLVGFTEYTALHGDEPARALLEHYYRDAGRTVRVRNGHTVKRIGDGLLLRFDRADDGVRAALDIVDSAPEPLSVRAGVHCGTVAVERDDVFGHAVNVTARVADAAGGGQVLATAVVREALGGSLL